MSLPDSRGGEATPRPVPVSYRLRPGHRLVRRGDTWHLVSPGDAVRRIRRPRAIVEAATEVLAGRRTANSAELTALLNGFAAIGALEEEPSPAPIGTVAVTGRGPVADAIRALLSDVLVDDAADVLVACALSLPDEEWVALDRACAGERALHLCHVDGDAVRLGPFARADQRPRYRDLRARRLAAAPDADLLRLIWAESPEVSAGAPTPAVAAIAAGMIVLDVRAALAGRDAPSHGTVVDVSGSGAVHRRPLLPIPEELQ